MSIESTVHIRPLDSKDLEAVSSCFAKEDFYYFTKRPNSLSLGEVSSILKDKKRTFYSLVDTDEHIRGLCDFKADLSNYRNVIVELRFLRDNDWSLNGQHGWFLFLKQLFDNHNFHKVTKFVYQFDPKSKTLCEKIGFRQEAVLKESIFKYGSYFDTYVYSMIQEDFTKMRDARSTTEIKLELDNPRKMLEGKIIRLRRIEDRDYPLLYKWQSSVTTYLNVDDDAYDISEEEYAETMTRTQHGSTASSIIFIIETRQGKPIGTIGLYNIDWRNKNAESVVAIGEERFLGLGYGSLASNVIRNYAFKELNLHKLYGSCFTCNERVMQSSKRGKVRFTANLKKSIFKNGEYFDVLIS